MRSSLASTASVGRCLADWRASPACRAAWTALRRLALGRRRCACSARLLCLAAVACARPLRAPLRSHRPPAAQSHAEPFVIAANPLAARGRAWTCCRRGGSAVDAAIAVQAMLSLVEPQSSGLGGGAFMTYYDARDRQGSTIYDGREVAPAQATPDDVPRRRRQAAAIRRRRCSAAARPAFPARSRCWRWRMREHGKLAVEQPVRRCRAHRARRLHRQPAARPADRAATCRRTARRTSAPISPKPDGSAAPGRRPAAQPGLCRLPAPARRAGARRALSPARPRRGSSRAPAPATARRVDDHGRPRQLPAGQARGAVPALSRLSCSACRRRRRAASGCSSCCRLLERTDIAERGPDDPQAWFLFAEASRLMYADRDRYVGDPAFVERAGRGPARPRLCRLARAADRRRPPVRRRSPAVPAGALVAAADCDARADRHLALHRPRRGRQCRVDDDHGRIDLRVGPDGRRLLPQQPDDRLLVQAASTPQGRPAANAVAPGKRPRSSMTPTDPARPRRQVRRSDRIGGRQCDPRLCRQVAGRGDRLGPADAAGAGPAEPRRARRRTSRARWPNSRRRCCRASRERGIDAEARPGRGFGRPRRAHPRRPGRRRLRPAPRRRGLRLPVGPRPPRRPLREILAIAFALRADRRARAAMRRADARALRRPSPNRAGPGWPRRGSAPRRRRRSRFRRRAISGIAPPLALRKLRSALERQRLQRRARTGRPASPAMTRPKRRPRDGGVGDDQRVDAVVDRGPDDPLDGRRARGPARP